MLYRTRRQGRAYDASRNCLPASCVAPLFAPRLRGHGQDFTRYASDLGFWQSVRRRSCLSLGGFMTTADTRVRTSAAISPRTVIVIAMPIIVGYVAIFVLAMQHTTYDTWGALWLGPALIAVSLPILLRYARRLQDLRLGRILVAALLFKLVAAYARYLMTISLYERGDFQRYSDTGAELRRAFLQGDFSLVQLQSGSRTGTQFVEIVTGIVYTIIGPSLIGGFLFFSWLSFWGLFFFYRAFRIGVPEGDHRRYVFLLFFLPSMLFWPSSIGKEAWMTFVLGMAVYGSALLIARQRGATIYLILGLAGILAVRPHMALLVVAGLAMGYLLRGFGRQRAVALGKMRTVLGLGVIGLITLLVTRRVAEFFGVDEFNLDTATATLEDVERRTEAGESEFTGAGPTLSNLPMNIVTVLFRPFLLEAHNLQSLMSAVEGTFLMLLFILSWPRIRTIPKQLFKHPYVSFCIVYAILFCFMFSAFQNFGNLVRQRVLVFPLILVLLALPFIQGRLPFHQNSPGVPEPTTELPSESRDLPSAARRRR